MWWCKSRHPCIRLLGTSAKCILWYKGFTPKRTELSSLQHLYWHHEQAKKREYGDRICGVENGSFTPLVFATTGGMGQEATLFYKYLADSLSEKRNIMYSKTIAWMRCTLSLFPAICIDVHSRQLLTISPSTRYQPQTGCCSCTESRLSSQISQIYCELLLTLYTEIL